MLSGASPAKLEELLLGQTICAADVLAISDTASMQIASRGQAEGLEIFNC